MSATGLWVGSGASQWFLAERFERSVKRDKLMAVLEAKSCHTTHI